MTPSINRSISSLAVKIIGYRKHHDTMSISKGVNLNGGHMRSPLCFPRIEVTAPPADSHATDGEKSTASKTAAPMHKRHGVPSHDFLEPPRNVLHSRHPLTPPPHFTAPRISYVHATPCFTPPVSISRRGSGAGAPHSLTVGSSMRKRASVGGIGLRSRTPSIYQRRGSRRMSAMEQLPFVVRWIIGKWIPCVIPDNSHLIPR